MEDRFKSTICVDIIFKKQIDNDIYILLMKRKNTGFNDGEYELPGGHLESGEDLYDAMIREVQEELVVDLLKEDIKIVQVFHHYSGKRINFIFESDGTNIDPKIGEVDKCDELKWVNINELPDNLTKKFRIIINNMIKGCFYDSL